MLWIDDKSAPGAGALAMEMIEMPEDGNYPPYPVPGDRIREATTFGRVSLTGLDDVFANLKAEHQQVLADVEGAIEASTSVGPRQAEEQQQDFVRRGLGGMIGADHFADGIDTFDGGVRDINDDLAVARTDWWSARTVELAEEELMVPLDVGPLGEDYQAVLGRVFEERISPTTLEWRAYKQEARHRYIQLREDLDTVAQESSRMIQDGLTDGAVAEMISAGTIPGHDLGLVLAAFPTVSVVALASWFRVQIDEGRINGLNDVPPCLDQYSAQLLLLDSEIFQSMQSWLHADASQGEADGVLIRDGVTGGPQWTNMVRRLNWIDAGARYATLEQDVVTGERENLPEDWLDYLAAVNGQAFGDGVSAVNEYLQDVDPEIAPQLGRDFASGLLTLSDPSIGGDHDRLPAAVIEAADPPGSIDADLVDIILNVGDSRRERSGSRLSHVPEARDPAPRSDGFLAEEETHAG